MNKKGFTLIEILAVLAILSLITIITIPIINSRREAANNKQYKTIVEDIENATKIYISNNPQALNDVSTGECIHVLISQLQTEKLLENSLIDPRDNSNISNSRYVNVCDVGDDLTYNFIESNEEETTTVQEEQITLNMTVSPDSCFAGSTIEVSIGNSMSDPSVIVGQPVEIDVIGISVDQGNTVFHETTLFDGNGEASISVPTYNLSAGTYKVSLMYEETEYDSQQITILDN